MMNGERNIKSVIWIALVLVAVYFFFFKDDSWIGFYYPNENNLTKHIQSSEFKSLEECRVWIRDQISKYNPSGYGYDYECGKNCKRKDSGLYLCKETLE